MFELSLGDKVIVRMKYFRAIAVILILALAATPALAAYCATSFASSSVMTSLVNGDGGADTVHCHDDSMNKADAKTHSAHKPCPMGACCHFAQATAIHTLLKHNFNASNKQFFVYFTPFDNSIDLSPPLKPPA